MAKTRNPRVERINKWTGRVIFGAVLLAALVFQVPWKVTLVVACVFASLIGLIPASFARSRRTKSFLVGAPLVAWSVWTLLPSNSGDYRPFVFVEEQARLEQEYGVPDDQNASAVYLRLLAQSEPNDRHLPVWLEKSSKAVLRRPWKSEDHPETARWLDARASMVETLKELGEYSQCHFPTEPMIQMLESSEPRTKTVKTWTYLLAAEANRQAGEGDIAGALQIYALIAKIASHYIQQVYGPHYLAGLAVEKAVFDGISGIAIHGSPTPAQLAAMDTLIATPSHEWASAWRRIMRFECLVVKNGLCGMVYEVNARGKIRFSRSGFADMKETESPYVRSVKGKRLASLMWVVLPRSPWKFARAIDKHYEQYVQIGQPDVDPKSLQRGHHLRFRANHEYLLEKLVTTMEPSYHKVSDIHTKSVATRQVCRIILLLRQYKDETGHWPETLAELAGRGDPQLWTDPLNGGVFVYRPEGQAFRLYTKGRNSVDEGGAGGDDFSFWPVRK